LAAVDVRRHRVAEPDAERTLPAFHWGGCTNRLRQASCFPGHPLDARCNRFIVNHSRIPENPAIRNNEPTALSFH
jgi:hypothetical protein